MSDIFKIVVFGSVDGEIKSFSQKLKEINSKAGPFDYCFVCGSLFDDCELNLDLLLGLDLVIPVYFICSDKVLPQTVEQLLSKDFSLARNLTFLGTEGILTTPNGLVVAYLGGVFNDLPKNEKNTNTYNSAQLEHLLRMKKQNIDLLLTYEAPMNIGNYSNLHKREIGYKNLKESFMIKDVANSLKPRYHFCGGYKTDSENHESLFFEREPYKNNILLENNNNSIKQHTITRFVSLANLNNTKKYRSYYAFKLTKQFPTFSETDLASKCTANPFVPQAAKFPEIAAGEEENSLEKYLKRKPSASYVCRVCGVPGHYINDCPKKLKKNRKETKSSRCWFCLNNPEVEKHIITSIFNETYLSIPKGSMLDETNKMYYAHVLISTIGHFKSFSQLLDKESLIENEKNKYITAIMSLYFDNDCVMFMFEVVGCFSIQHAHLEAVPLPNTEAQTIVDLILLYAQENKMQKIVFDKIDFNKPYVWINVNNKEIFYLQAPETSSIELNFGRKVVMKILNISENKTEWRSCVKTKEEETAIASKFKDKFKKYDPSLES